MKRVATASLVMAVCLGSTACVAGPGGVHNAANRAVGGAAIGALLGGIVGVATGDPSSGIVIGTAAGAGIGAAVNPKVLDNGDTRGYCYTVDAQGRPIMVPLNSVECKRAAAASSSTASR